MKIKSDIKNIVRELVQEAFDRKSLPALPWFGGNRQLDYYLDGEPCVVCGKPIKNSSPRYEIRLTIDSA